MWHCFQRKDIGITVYNPVNEGIQLLSDAIYDILAKEYETAPENERLQEFFNFSHLTEDSFLEYRNKVEWFFLHSYINIGCYEDYLESLKEEIEMLDSEERLDEETETILLYSHLIKTILFNRTPLLAITAPEYIKLIQEYNQADCNAPFMNIEALQETFYLVKEVKDDYVVFKDLIKDNASYIVKKNSLNIDSRLLLSGKTFFE